MKYAFIMLMIFSTLILKGQEKFNNFKIVDVDTKKAIPFVSVSLARANLAMTTEADGVLSIPGDLAKFNDIIFISAQNYITAQALLNKLNGMDTISLKRSVYQSPNVAPSTIGKDSIMNQFDWRNVSYFAGLHTQNGRFNYLQMAQEFNTPVAGATLQKIFICRLAHHGLMRAVIVGGESADSNDIPVVIENQEKYVDLEHTRFRLRFYDVDPRTGGPGRDICSDIVEVRNKDDQNVTVDLKSHNIVIPGKKFFVAIEWLRLFDNAGYVGSRSEENLIYKPTMGLLPYKTSKLNIWGLTYGHKWQLYTYYSPDWTDLAISATLKW